MSRSPLVLLFLILFASCSGGGASKTLIYLAPTLLDEFQTEAVEVIESTFTEMGYTVRTLDGQNRSDVQLNQLDDAVLLNPEAIILAAVDFDAVVPGIERVRAAGIPVFAFDRQITSTLLDFTSVAGTVEIGRTAGTEVARLLTERYSEARGSVLQITGDPGDNYALDIQNGFDEILQAHPGIRLITKAALQWEASNAGDIAEDQLLVTPDLDLIFVHAAHLAVPVVSVLEGSGKGPGDVMVVSSNGAPVGLALIRDGWEQVEVEQPLYAQIAGLATYLGHVLRKEPIEPGPVSVLGRPATLTIEPWGPQLSIPGEAITAETVDDPRFWGNLRRPSLAPEDVHPPAQP